MNVRGKKMNGSKSKANVKCGSRGEEGSAIVIALFVLVAARTGVRTPIVEILPRDGYADPVPQAVILTAIVIGFSIQALMLVGVMKLARDNPTLETRAIEKEYRP